jgi:phosphatidylserine decarboxylase
MSTTTFDGTNTTSTTSPAFVVEQLQQLLDNNEAMRNDLLHSIQVASNKAKTALNTDLYQAINEELHGNGWPTTIEHYYDYLDSYVRLVPNESNNPNYPNAWHSTGTSNGYNQKVYDLLCQFYWLVDQPNAQGKTMQSYEAFAYWLVDFAQAWGAFLDTEASLTPESLRSFKYNPMYNYPLYADHASSWKTFNQFFSREFNQADAQTGLSPLRPIAAPQDNQTLAAPADCTFKARYQIDEQGNVLDHTGAAVQVTLKHTHTIGTIQELLDGSPHTDAFKGGTFVHYFLGPYDYHRFHTPVHGDILEIRAIQDKVYLAVNLENGQFDAPDAAQDGYEFQQTRGLVVVDAGAPVGKVAILPIGMAQVSGVNMYTELKDQTVVKGQEFGKFLFGGSDIILLFEKNPALYLFKRDPGHVPIHFQYGQTLGYWNEAEQS